MKISTGSIAVAVCLAAGTAVAHPHLQKSTPAEGSSLSMAPSFVELMFSEPARITALSIQKDQSAPEALKTLPTDTKPTAKVALPALAPGAYAISWRVIGSDGHVMSGTLHFTVATTASTPNANPK